MAASNSNPIHQFFHGVKIADLISEKKANVISLKTTDSIEQTMKQLSQNKILSAPVLNDKGECVGFIDMLDILKFITKAAPNEAALQQGVLESLKIAGRAISLVTIDNIVDFSGRDPLLAIQLDSPVTGILPYFAKGFHRAAVYDKDKLVGVVSQSDVVRALSKNVHMGHLKEIGRQSLQELGYASAQIERVDRSTKVIDVLKLMAEKGYGQVPIIDPATNNLYANFSASDIRGLYQQDFPHLLDPIDRFLAQQSPNSLKPICALPRSTLIDVVNELAGSKLHHLWTINMSPPFTPLGIITLTDIMKIAVAKM